MAEFKWKNDVLEEDEEDSGILSASDLGTEDDDADEFSVDEEEDLTNSDLDELDY